MHFPNRAQSSAKRLPKIALLGAFLHAGFDYAYSQIVLRVGDFSRAVLSSFSGYVSIGLWC